uniref:Uncharacterized protein n=1 Tax=Arundo donax TaxID=35708 RepID=A0A0A8YLW6_ARUDO
MCTNDCSRVLNISAG